MIISKTSEKGRSKVVIEVIREFEKHFSIHMAEESETTICCCAEERGCSHCGQGRPGIQVCVAGIPKGCDKSEIREIVITAAGMLRAIAVENVGKRRSGIHESE